VEVEPLSTALIERYLQARELRYYQGRGGKDLLVLFTTDHGRLHVNLQICGKRGDVLVVAVSPAAYYHAADRSRLMELVNEWNRDTHWPKAFVRETARPNRITVVGENAYPLPGGIHSEALASFVDCTVEYATDLFDKIAEAISLPSAQALEEWLDRTG
jgi:hypothetical protein